jgi:hypothetical protein
MNGWPFPDKSHLAGLAHEPLLHFALFAGCLFAASTAFGPDDDLVEVTRAEIEWRIVQRPRIPRHLFVVPVLWAVVGSTAVGYFGVLEDAMFPAAAVAAVALTLKGGGRSRGVSGEAG